MTLSPTIEWRNPTTPFATFTSLAFTGSGYNNSIPVGTSSNAITFRIYNNFANAASIDDAHQCVLAVYDDGTHQGTALTPASLGHYVEVKITNYNGSTTDADPDFIGIGGSVKHLLPTNSGAISGSGTNYITVIIQITVPAIATQGAVTQGLWLEYTSTA